MSESKEDSDCIINDYDGIDDDTCTREELEKLFKHKYILHDNLAVTSHDSYALCLAKDDAFTHVAAGLSDGSVRLFETNSEKGVYIKPPVDANNFTICGVRFLDETSNLLLVGTTNGIIRLLDMRIRNEVYRIVYKPIDRSEPSDILSFDRNSTGRLLAVGTEEKTDNVNIVFYDLRTSKEMFRYRESHQDNVTSLSFNPEDPDILCSGSTDGLINIFNIRVMDDYNAILTTINTESTVHKVNWHKNKQGKCNVSCTTDSNGVKAYNFDGDIIANFDRLKISETIKRKNDAYYNVINCHSLADDSMMLLIGSKNGSVLRSCKVQNEQLFPYSNFEANNQTVRESVFDSKNNILMTAGESGFVTLWTPLAWQTTAPCTTNFTPCNSSKMKAKNSNRSSPY